jgi:hypothetical protein
MVSDWVAEIDYGPILKLFGKRVIKYYVYVSHDGNKDKEFYAEFTNRNDLDICLDRLRAEVKEYNDKHNQLIVCECGCHCRLKNAIYDEDIGWYVCPDCYIMKDIR